MGKKRNFLKVPGQAPEPRHFDSGAHDLNLHLREMAVKSLENGNVSRWEKKFKTPHLPYVKTTS